MTFNSKIGSKVKGQVVQFDDHVGLGEILTDEKEIYPFHCVNIKNETRSIDVGENIVAEIYFHPRGRLELRNIEVI